MVDSADAVVVGGGTVGAWCAYFLRASGVGRVVLLEKDRLGQGASSRAAGIVRTQGGTAWAVQLGEWSRRFYLGQAELLGIDSGFTPQGYVLPCFTPAEVTAAHERMAMQNSLGLDVRWLEPDEFDRMNPAMAPGLTLGATYCAEDGYLHPPRNVTAYAHALAVSGVRVLEHTSFTALDVTAGAVTGVQTSEGRDRRAAGRADRRARARRGRQAGRHDHPGRRGPAPGGGHRAAPRPGSRQAAHALRPRGRPVLAAGGRRHAVRHVEPGRAARRGPLRGHRVPGADPAAPAHAGRR